MRKRTTAVTRQLVAHGALTAAVAVVAVGCGGGWLGEADQARVGGGSSYGGGADAGSAPYYPPTGGDAGVSSAASDAGVQQGNTNINLGGAQDFGYFRGLLAQGTVPRPDQIEAAGFFAEHHTPLPPPSCGERVCLQAMLGVMGNLVDGENCTMLQLGLNSPIVASPDNRPPLTLAVVIDTSGSMRNDSKMGYVQEGLELMIDALHDDDQIALISYAKRAETVFPLSRVGDRRLEMRETVRRLRAVGSTNLYEGLREGYLALQNAYDSGRQNRLLLLSDGVPTEGITAAGSIVSMSAAFNSEGLGITTIGLGTDFNHDLMRRLAEQGDGNFYFLENTAAVREVFHEEISYFTVPVAFDVSLELRTTGTYSYSRAFGSRLWQDTGNGGRLDVPSVFLAHRVAHSDVSPGGGRRGGGSALLVELMPNISADDGSGATFADVATIDVTYREPGTDRIVRDEVVVRYPYAPWDLPQSGFFDTTAPDIVQKSFVMLNIYVGIQQATFWFYAGQGERAVGILLRLIAAVEDFNDGLNGGTGDVDMEYDIELLRDLIRVMEQNGATTPSAPAVPEDPWPAD